jgi:hypothetical protein
LIFFRKSLQLEGVFSCALDDGLKALSRNSPNVAVLNLSGCAQISGDCLTDLFTKWHHLTTVNLACLPQLSDRQLRTLVDLCPSVTNVTLDSNTLNGPVLSYAVNRIGARLEYLSMQYCRAVNDDVFKDVLRSCPNLRHLDVHACHSITDFGVLNAATPLSRLSTINLSLCTLLTERSVLLLMRLSPNLQRLSLFRSNGATNNVRFNFFLIFNPSARHLNCTCFRYFRQILLFISQNYPSFLYLDVQGCANISLPALQSLRQSCSLLELCSSFKEVCRFRPINPDEVVAMEL